MPEVLNVCSDLLHLEGEREESLLRHTETHRVYGLRDKGLGDRVYEAHTHTHTTWDWAYLFSHGPFQNVVCSARLVGSYEFWDIDGGSGSEVAHVWAELLLEGPIKDLGSLHRTAQVHG